VPLYFQICLIATTTWSVDAINPHSVWVRAHTLECACTSTSTNMRTRLRKPQATPTALRRSLSTVYEVRFLKTFWNLKSIGRELELQVAQLDFKQQQRTRTQGRYQSS
jgi:hypothetical protein